MRTPPGGLDQAQLLSLVRASWDVSVDRLDYLPVGFGAHHWAGLAGGVPRLFVTFDALRPPHDSDSLEAAYAGAAALQRGGLEFVLGSLPARSGRFTVPLTIGTAPGAVSVTPWRDGHSGDGPHSGRAAASDAASRLARLHRTPAPPGIPHWTPLVSSGLAEHLEELTTSPWTSGPYAERARAAIRDRLAEIADWTARYHALAGKQDPATWVVTHGEPHTSNELHTTEGVFLVDWETLQLAPRERDLRDLLEEGLGPEELGPIDSDNVELFDLQWRLDEIAQYSEWFHAPHLDGEDDAIAFGGLLEELGR